MRGIPAVGRSINKYVSARNSCLQVRPGLAIVKFKDRNEWR